MMSEKFKIVNIVAIQNCGFRINERKAAEHPNVYCDIDRNGREWWKLKINGTSVTFWYNGNLISVGNKSIPEAKRNLESAKRFLKRYSIPLHPHAKARGIQGAKL